MTNHTLETCKLVLHHQLFSLGNHRFMAVFASRGLVFPFELERRFIVIEFFDRPNLKAVAAGAIRNSFLGKLSSMRIIMTIGASGMQAGKTPILVPLFGYVALAALQFCVLPF